MDNIIYRQIDINTFSDENLNDIKEVQSDVLADDGYDDDFWYEIITTATSSYIAYEQKNNKQIPVGYIIDTYLPEEGDYYIIASFGVKKDYQNKKIGTTLLNLCLEGLQEKIKLDKKIGINRQIKLQVRFSNSAGKRFYERNGFYCNQILQYYYGKLLLEFDNDTDSNDSSDDYNIDDMFEHGYEMIYTDNPSERYSHIK